MKITRGGVESSSEKMAREFAILQKALQALQLEVAELKKPVPQKALEAAQRSYQKKVEQLQKVQAKMVALNTKIEAKKRQTEAKIGSSVKNSLQNAGNLFKNDVKQTLEDLKLAGQKAVSAGKYMIAADQYAGQKVDQAAEFVVQASYDNLVSRPSRGIENSLKQMASNKISLGENTAQNIEAAANNIPNLNLYGLIKDRKIKNPVAKELFEEHNVPKEIDTIAKYENYAFGDGVISKNERFIIDTLLKLERTLADYQTLAKDVKKKIDLEKQAQKERENSSKIATGLNYIAKTDIRDVAKDAQNKLKNLFGKKKNNSQSPTN